MKKTILFSLITSILCLSFIFVNRVFPTMEGEKLDGTKITLPTDIKGKESILILAFSQKAEDDLKTWQIPIYQKFIYKPKKGTELMFSGYDLNLFFVPMFTGVNQTAEGQAKKKMQKEIDPEYQSHFIVYKGDLKLLKEPLKIEKKDEPYIYVLDAEGNISYQTSGAFSETKLNEIEDHLEQ